MSRHEKLKYRGDYSICSICLAEVKKGKEKRLPCHHILHKKCFERLRSKGHWKCPYCREPFTKRSKKCSYEAKIDNFHVLEDEVSPVERMDRRSYWDNLRLLPPLTPPGSANSRREVAPAHRGREVDSPLSRSRSRRDKDNSSLSGRAKRESPLSRRRVQLEPIETRGRQRYQADNRERRNRSSYMEDDDKESDDELYNQVVENLTEEPFFRFFSSNIVHEHEEREGTRWSRSRRASPEPIGRRDRAE